MIEDFEKNRESLSLFPEDLRIYASFPLPPNVYWEKRPRFLERLRRKFEPLANSTTINPRLVIPFRSILNFLEKGILRDDFGANDEERDNFYLQTKLEAGEAETSLYTIATRANKLKGNALSAVITAIQLLDVLQPSLSFDMEKTFSEKGEDLAQTVREIKNTRGYFNTEDLEPFEDIARVAIKKIAQLAGIEISDEDFEED